MGDEASRVVKFASIRADGVRLSLSRYDGYRKLSVNYMNVALQCDYQDYSRSLKTNRATANSAFNVLAYGLSNIRELQNHRTVASTSRERDQF